MTCFDTWKQVSLFKRHDGDCKMVYLYDVIHHALVSWCVQIFPTAVVCGNHLEKNSAPLAIGLEDQWYPAPCFFPPLFRKMRLQDKWHGKSGLTQSFLFLLKETENAPPITSFSYHYCISKYVSLSGCWKRGPFFSHCVNGSLKWIMKDQ